MKGLFIPDITAEMFRNGCLEGIEALMAEGEIYDIYYEPERLTDDDFETIRIHLNACKEELCNQRRWNEAKEYQRIIDRFMTFASAQPERKNGEWEELGENKDNTHNIRCNQCSEVFKSRGHANSYYTKRRYRFCPNCGADMRGEANGN